MAVKGSGKLKTREFKGGNARVGGGDFIAGIQSGKEKKRDWRVSPNLAEKAGALKKSLSYLYYTLSFLS